MPNGRRVARPLVLPQAPQRRAPLPALGALRTWGRICPLAASYFVANTGRFDVSPCAPTRDVADLGYCIEGDANGGA